MNDENEEKKVGADDEHVLEVMEDVFERFDAMFERLAKE